MKSMDTAAQHSPRHADFFKEKHLSKCFSVHKIQKLKKKVQHYFCIKMHCPFSIDQNIPLLFYMERKFKRGLGKQRKEGRDGDREV